LIVCFPSGQLICSNSWRDSSKNSFILLNIIW
jgi:hypothetical protein